MSGSQSTDALVEELVAFCRSESLSEDGLREIFERQGCAPNNNNHVYDYDFFLWACRNERVTEGILRCLLEYFPDAVNATTSRAIMPLHYICANKNATQGMVQLIIDACRPESIDRGDDDGWTPLHTLCINKNLENSTAVDILGLFLKRCPESVRHALGGEDGRLPIHIAAGQGAHSLEFCRMLIEAYPGSERMTVPEGGLPLHVACGRNTVAVAEYLYKLYPESINVANGDGIYPIHEAIGCAVEMVQFLLDCDPNVASQKLDGNLPLYWTCKYYAEMKIKVNAAVKIAQLLYDAHPEAITEDACIARDLRTFPEEIRTFINTQLNLARLARNSTARQMKKRDENGQVPLHRALRDNATLGSIKLIVKRNPSALLIPDNSGWLPLHLACQYYDSPNVVDYLIGLDPNTLTAVDRMGNTALHLACRGAKHDTIALLLEKYGAVSVSQSNALNKLPVHLLFESNSVNRADDTKYLESVFQLLRAYPETVMVSEDTKQASIPQGGRPSRSGKKRKYCA